MTEKLEWHTPTVTELIISEEWRSVIGYEGLYEVSNYGRVKVSDRTVHHPKGGQRFAKGRILKPCGRHYLGVGIHKNGISRRESVHALELAAFVGPCPEGQQCRHLNGDPRDNRLINLVWGSAQANREDQKRHGTQTQGERHHRAKLTKWNVLIDIPVLTARGMTLTQMADELHVSRSTIHLILTGKIWNHLYERTVPIVRSTYEQSGVKKSRRIKGIQHRLAKLTDAAVADIRTSDEKGVVLARRYGVSQTTVSWVRKGKGWKHVG